MPMQDVELSGISQTKMTAWDALMLKYAIATTPEWRCCLTPDCQNGVLWQHGSHPLFACEACGMRYCVSCQTDAHDGLSCQQFLAWRQENEEVGISKAAEISFLSLQLLVHARVPIGKDTAASAGAASHPVVFLAIRGNRGWINSLREASSNDARTALFPHRSATVFYHVFLVRVRITFPRTATPSQLTIILQRNEGCCHMVCRQCRHDWSWKVQR